MTALSRIAGCAKLQICHLAIVFWRKKCNFAERFTVRLLYRFVLSLSSVVVPVLSFFNSKMRKGADGRRSTLEIIHRTIGSKDQVFWFHCASLGEFEQGRPVFEALVAKHPTYKVVLSFFSPSGYEHCPNLDWISAKVYMPLDSKKNAEQFIAAVHPSMAVFVKYDIWPNHLRAIYHTGGRAVLISAVFRPSQVYFKNYGQMFASALNAFEHIFVQDDASKQLLNQHGFDQVTVSGDTRYDRVSINKATNIDLPDIERFVDNRPCFVAGSIWPDDLDLISTFLNIPHGPKCILVPHEIDENAIAQLQKQLIRSSVLYSKSQNQKLEDFEILIIDCVGLLSKIYHFADVAYVGGAAGTTGMHNVLEPAVFGCPIVIGKNHQRYPEATSLIEHGGMFSVSHPHVFYQTVSSLFENHEERVKLGRINSDFVASQCGATAVVTNYFFEHPFDQNHSFV